MERFIYVLTHTWCFANGVEGRYDTTFTDIDEAFKCFKNLQEYIANDEYDFDVQFTPYCDGDMSFSAYESVDSLINRQDLVLKQLEF